MTTIGILSEGRTDQKVIKQVLLGFFANQGDAADTLVIHPFFPPEVTLPGEPEVGGWTVLKRRLEDGHHLQALQYNDYIVIHIDTDVCEDPGYDVPRHDPGTMSALEPAQLREAVKARLIEWLGDEFFATHGHRVLFAIAVDTIECWLLPLLETQPAKQSKTTGCAKAVNKALERAGRDFLDKGNVLKRYADETALYRKHKVLTEKGRLNPSLNAFLRELTDRNIQLEAD
jgi:hypothetical protein